MSILFNLLSPQNDPFDNLIYQHLDKFDRPYYRYLALMLLGAELPGDDVKGYITRNGGFPGRGNSL